MKRSLTILIMMFATILIMAQSKPVITVLDFKTSGVSEREMKSIISLISNTLFKTGKYIVIDVAQREILLKEIEFSLSDCVDERCQVEIGKQLSAELIVVGSIDKVEDNFIFASKILETQTARTVSVADGVYSNLNELVRNIGRIGSELSGEPSIADQSEKIFAAAVPAEQERSDIHPGFVLVEGGSFRMGSKSGHRDEQPVHAVKTGRSFYMSRYEVTQRQWVEVMGGNPSTFQGDDLPVENVTWFEATEYCNRLSRKEGLTACYSGSGASITCNFSAKGYRLPTEAEWEYAARGGNQSREYTYAGSNSPGEVGWYADNSEKTTHRVGQKRPNELGLYDLSGNVWEWCWDKYAAYSAAMPTTPSGIAGYRNRVNRGGGWFYAADYLRSTCRGNFAKWIRNGNMGFRPVRTAG